MVVVGKTSAVEGDAEAGVKLAVLWSVSESCCKI